MLILAGVTQASRNPPRTLARLAVIGGALLVVGVTVFIIRGDLLRSSGLDDSADSGCGYERVC